MGMCLTKYKITKDIIENYDIVNEYDNETLYLGKNLSDNETKILNDLEIPFFIKKNLNDDYVYNEIFSKLVENLNDDYVQIIFDEEFSKFIVLNEEHSNIFTSKYHTLISLHKNKGIVESLEKEYNDLYNIALINKDDVFGKTYLFKDFDIPIDLNYRLKNKLIELDYMGKPFRDNKKTKDEYSKILNSALGNTKESCVTLTCFHNDLKDDFSSLIVNKDFKKYFEDMFPLEKDEIIRIDW